MSILQRLFGRTDEAERIRKAEERIAVELESVADDLAQHRERRREVLHLPSVKIVEPGEPAASEAPPAVGPRPAVTTALERKNGKPVKA